MGRSKLEIPGGIEIREASPVEQKLDMLNQNTANMHQGLVAVFEQLGQVVIVLNTIAGQLDTLLRMESQAVQKKVIKQKFDKHDEEMRAIREAAEQAAEARKVREAMLAELPEEERLAAIEAENEAELARLEAEEESRDPALD